MEAIFTENTLPSVKIGDSIYVENKDAEIKVVDIQEVQLQLVAPEKKFFQLYQEGSVQAHAIDDYIDKWHDSQSKEELHDYLGMSFDKYKNWVVRGTFVGRLLFSKGGNDNGSKRFDD
ncbi:hypothetical protein PP175_28660 (plasmid) [Aneurinibacillus sp. Ricciae_BoGa-3]|uniref:hypothetical protein n=1 Tax=Aneurinibacillus sp. Ricciae_BoGa-3 TaxID=3022697 RepID=UPI00234274AD|nr:hypothetical protein [Aneurinibacillus sp. Ricciae_BoGa-3]WCK57162.1 hypothetical protein PP175_28660 [Aneurinibacillus sp. Ricciae_BoGa-3]